VKRRYELPLLEQRVSGPGVRACESGHLDAADARIRVERIRGDGVLRVHLEGSEDGGAWRLWPGCLVSSPCGREHRPGKTHAEIVADFARRSITGAPAPGAFCDGEPIHTLLEGLGGVWPFTRVGWEVDPGSEFALRVSLVGWIG
jgi:hypothetical protein